MAERKEKLIRVLQIIGTTDEKSPMNASQIIERLANKYELIDIDRTSIYRDILRQGRKDIILLQLCFLEKMMLY